MKIAVFYDKTEEKTANELTTLMNPHPCEVLCYSTESLCDTADFSTVLQGVTHMVFIAPEKNAAGFERDAAFLLGLGVGKGLPIIVVLSGSVSTGAMPCELEKYRHLVAVHTLDTFEEYIVRERNNFLALEKKKRAYDTLLDLLRETCFTTYFARAAREGQCAVMQLFLDAGFSSSQRDTEGTPMLLLAVQHAQYDAVSFLLEHGADVNLCSEDRKYSALMEAVVLGSVKFAQLLLSHRADVNIQSKEGQTALILAVGKQDIPMVKLLLEHHADKHIKDKLGMSALAYAKLFNNKDMLDSMQD